MQIFFCENPDAAVPAVNMPRNRERRAFAALSGQPLQPLADQAAVRAAFERAKPEYVFLAAARVGGIHANNTYPADFIYSNLQIQTNVIVLMTFFLLKVNFFLYAPFVRHILRIRYATGQHLRDINAVFGRHKKARLCRKTGQKDIIYIMSL